jgi:hypothetical protein
MADSVPARLGLHRFHPWSWVAGALVGANLTDLLYNPNAVTLVILVAAVGWTLYLWYSDRQESAADGIVDS